MIGRPTTEQVLLDCCRVLMDDVLPAVADETTQVRVVMLDKVLRNAAVRVGHEIAWMDAEVAAIEAYGEAVEAATGAGELRGALDELVAARRDSLHLADVVEAYCRAGEVLSVALEQVLTAERLDLVRQGEALLADRLAHEDDVVGGWEAAGR